MSELINNREYRKQVIREVILDLHQGKSVDEVKSRFHEVIKDIDAGEIAIIEESLVQEGLPIGEVQRLCDVHASLFKDVLEHKTEAEIPPGHPIHTFREENKALEKLLTVDIGSIMGKLAENQDGQEVQSLILSLTEKINLLMDVDKHYSRKENLLFPLLEKYGITAPPKVMWGVDDEIRAALKEAREALRSFRADEGDAGNVIDLMAKVSDSLNKVTEMIFKEEKILFPMALETLAEDEWYRIYEDSDEIGYCLVEPTREWNPVRVEVGDKPGTVPVEKTPGQIKFNTGVLKAEEINLIFNHLPVDITFVDKAGIVKYFSAGPERIFPRTRTIIGRKVENCHPPASVDVVEKLVTEFVEGKKNEESFWLHLGDKYVLIRYFAVRDDAGEFQGVLEVSQDFKPLQAIQGEKRIAD